MENLLMIKKSQQAQFTYSTAYAGFYQIGTEGSYIILTLKTKPKWLRRKFVQILLGWKWVDKSIGS